MVSRAVGCSRAPGGRYTRSDWRSPGARGWLGRLAACCLACWQVGRSRARSVFAALTQVWAWRVSDARARVAGLSVMSARDYMLWCGRACAWDDWLNSQAFCEPFNCRARGALSRCVPLKIWQHPDIHFKYLNPTQEQLNMQYIWYYWLFIVVIKGIKH